MQVIRKHEELTLCISSRSGTNSAVCSANSSDFNIGAAAAAVQGAQAGFGQANQGDFAL